MPEGLTIVERAFQLARTGRFAEIGDLIAALKREGYDQVEAHIDHRSGLRRQLTRECRSAWAAAK